MAARARFVRLAAAGATILLTVGWLGCEAAWALDPPPAASLAGLGADVAVALREARRIAGVIGVAPEVVAGDAACADFLAGADACRVASEDACRDALVEAVVALRRARATLPPRRAAAADAVLSDLFDVASRVALARDAVARGGCASVAPEGALASQMLLGPDERSVLVRPLVALRGGRRYALIARGVAEPLIAELRGALVPRPHGDGITIPPGAFSRPIAALLPDDAGGISAARLGELVARLERDADAVPGLGAFAGVRVTFPEQIRPDQIGTLQLAFAPASEARASETLAVYRVLDARRGLLEARARLASLDCVSTPAEARDAKETLGARLPNIATLLHGTYRSLAVLGDASSGPLGLAAAGARPVELPYLLALPHGYGPSTPLVIAVDGHSGSAARILGKQAGALTERGLAVMAVEQPRHGERQEPGLDYLDALDPAALGRMVRQAAVDVLGAVAAATGCGLALPDGSRLRVPEVRYLGYSLGAMVGAIVRSVEPRVGTAVFVAPGGDILGWLLLRVSPAMGATYVTCLGGAQEGENCVATGQCTPPGVCMVDPFLDRLHWIVALPYEVAAAPADPLSYVTHRTGTSSAGRLLLITGGEDAALHPALATRLADAYGMAAVGPHRRRGPRSRLVQWPELGHELVDRPGVRAQIAAFLASDGRGEQFAPQPAAPTAPGG